MDKLEKAAFIYSDDHGFRVPYDGTNEFYDLTDVNASREGFLAGAEWQMNNIWISVEEELPENIGEDYGFSEDVIISNHDFCVGYYDYRTKKWMCRIMENLEIENVTHWMPIPKLNK